ASDHGEYPDRPAAGQLPPATLDPGTDHPAETGRSRAEGDRRQGEAASGEGRGRAQAVLRRDPQQPRATEEQPARKGRRRQGRTPSPRRGRTPGANRQGRKGDPGELPLRRTQPRPAAWG
ncbi:hypothetical protein, partial [Pseudomonas aeruginosa]|uniref:hypothetical protein n=2 Tax=Pseudomonas aeruginosa TaxID=287 RepID=UPI003A5C5FDD